ncbi:glycoside hydrolase family 43 protein [Sedimentisphaera salicampi]|uniref:Beta-xylosidase n=1 Tax=Sedimentisphaera salicampi TaxID=1941349 RepID=A0A1W6LJJ4_9BACT|nr:glycoside hydrolase family 43 protein [Sedimentisphaera salicampi]ARN55951.1 Beta-xylosidase [Sedimentisphaera salicampi]
MNFQITAMAVLAGFVFSLNAADSFKPYVKKPDNNGVHLNAHGAGVMHHDGKYYLYGEHKIAGRAGNKAHVGVHCYSSEDLYNWKDEGIALKVVEKEGHDIEKGCIIERPKVIYNEMNDNFVMWFHLELKGQGYSAARTGLAVSDNPTGEFEYIRSFRPNAGQWPIHFPKKWQKPISEKKFNKLKEESDWDYWLTLLEKGIVLRRDFKEGQMSRDMTVFVDDNGKAYHIHSSEDNSTLHISELTDDYQDFTGRYTRARPGGYNEAPALCKYEGSYYLIASGCSGWAPNTARSFRASNIMGEWKALGNPCKGKNPHNDIGSIKTFGGQSTYILPVEGKRNAFIAMFDVWRPSNQIDSRYMWLPAKIKDNEIVVEWQTEWDLSYFEE